MSVETKNLFFQRWSSKTVISTFVGFFALCGAFYNTEKAQLWGRAEYTYTNTGQLLDVEQLIWRVEISVVE